MNIPRILKRLSTPLPCLAAILLSGSLAAEEPFVHGKEYTFDAAKIALPNATSQVRTLGKFRGIGCSATTGTEENIVLELGKTFPPGDYQIAAQCLTWQDGLAALNVAYPDAKGERIEIAALPWGDFAGAETVRQFFTARVPFSRLYLHKPYDSDRATQALGEFKLQMCRETHWMRLANQREVLRHPAPFGIRSDFWLPEIERLLQNDNVPTEPVLELIAKIADWQDASAIAIDRLGEYRELRLIGADNPAYAETLKTLDAVCNEIRAAFAARELPRAAAAVQRLTDGKDALHARLNREYNGEVLADFGNDLYTWVKNFELGEPRTNFDCQEPMPCRLDAAGRLRLNFEPVGTKIDFVAGRTDSIYESDLAVYAFSSLNAAQLIRPKRGEMTIRFDQLRPEVRVLSPHAIELVGAKGNSLLLVGAGKLTATADSTKAATELHLAVETGRWFALLPAGPGVDRKKLVNFYRPFIDRLPIRVAQIQRGETVEQYLFDAAGRPAAFAPVSPLVELSQTSPYPVRFQAKTIRTPDGKNIVPGVNRFTYTLPDRPRRAGIGVNLWNYPNLKEEIFRSLAEQGCPSIRLTVGIGETEPVKKADWQNPEVVEKVRFALLRNLAMARKYGLKVGIDNHLGMFPDNDEKYGKTITDPRWIAEFARRWSMIVTWAEPYRDMLLWYDMWNEPGIDANPDYWTVLRNVLPQLRKLDPKTPFLVEVTHGANAIGARYWQDTGDPDTILGFHLYQLLIFTHQRQPIQAGGSSSEDIVHYPAWQPLIALNAPDWRDCQPWIFFDRYQAEGALYPVLERAAITGLPLDCGEFGVIQGAKKSPNSGVLWLSDTFRQLRRIGSSGMVWCRYPDGFVWPIPPFVETVLRQWKPKEIPSPPTAGFSGSALSR